MDQSSVGGSVPSVQPQRLAPKRSLVLVVSSFGGFLVTFMISAINVALPLIQEEFQISAVTLSWISLAYVLVAGAALLPAGRLADLRGQVRYFVYGMVIFTVFAFASAFAPSAEILIVLRAIHGIGLAVGSVVAIALVTLAYPPHILGRALGLNVAGVYLGLTLGPVLGGLIIHNLGWRSLFLVIGALGLGNLVASMKLLHLDQRKPKEAPFDVTGSILFAVGLTALLAGLSFVPALSGVVLIVVGVAGLSAFFWWETRAADPLLDVGLLRTNRVFGFANVAALINYAATFAMVFLMSLYLQYNRGLDPQTAGLVLVTGTFVQAVLSPVAGRLVDKLQARYIATAGMLVCVVGLLALGFVDLDTSYGYIIAMLCVLGVGYAFFSTPITHAVMGSVPVERVSMASATLAMMRQVGQNLSMGIATLVLALQVGREAIQPADYPGVLSSVRVSFWIFAALCALGTVAAAMGPKRNREA